MPGHITLQATSVQKLCECLLTLATYSASQPATLPLDSAEGGSVEGGKVATIQTTQPALFERAGVSPRTGARALALLSQAGVVESRGRGSLTILDTQRLSELAAEGGKVAASEGGKGGEVPPVKAGRVAASAGGKGGEVASLRVSLAAAAGEVEGLRVSLAAAAGEVESLRAEVAALRSSVVMGEGVGAAPTLTPPFDVDALVGRIVDALRVTLPATSPPVTAEGGTVEAATLPPSDAATLPVKGRGSRGVVDDLEALKQLVSLAKDKRGKGGSMSGAARLLGVTEGGVRHALRVGRVTPELAEKVRVALASLDAAGG